MTRIAAPEIEAAVMAALRSAVPTSQQAYNDAELVAKHLDRAIVHPGRLAIHLTGERDPITLPWSPASTRRRRDIVVPPGRDGQALRPMKVEDRVRILKAIGTGRAWLEELAACGIASTAAIASREILSERAVRMTLSLAHLAPAIVRAIVRAIVEGRLPRNIGVRDLAELAPTWAEQERALGM